MMRRMDLNGNRCISYDEFVEAVIPIETPINDQPFRQTNDSPKPKQRRTKNGSPIGPETSPLRSEYEDPALKALKKQQQKKKDSPMRSSMRDRMHSTEETSKIVTFS